MNPLRAADLLRLWELWEVEGRCPPSERGIMLLRGATARPLEELRELTIGQLEAELLALRRATFGAKMHAKARCVACGEWSEIVLSAEELEGLRASLPPHPPEWHELSREGYRVVFRVPRVADLMRLGGGSPRALRLRLLGLCVREVTRAEVLVSVEELPDTIQAALSERMEALDPCADIQLALTCPACRREWAAPFDVGRYLWAEVATHARRTLREVDALARLYGWREADILAMSSRRRRAYLELNGF